MKRKPSSEQFTQQMAFKQTTKKSRSPNNLKRPKHKFQNQILSFLAPPKSKIIKQKDQYHKSDLKGDSHNATTNCTFSKSRLPKGKKKQKQEKGKKHQNLTESEIMMIINNFAIKIQRQWRVHLLRKHFKQFINSLVKKRRQSQAKHSPQVSAFDKLKFDQNKIKHLSYLTQNGEEIVSSYNLQKYESYDSSSIINSKEIQNNDPLSYRSQTNSDKYSIRLQSDPFEVTKKYTNFASQKSYGQDNINNAPNKKKEDLMKDKIDSNTKVVSSKIFEQALQRQDRRISYDSCQLQKKSNLQNRRHSTGDLLLEARELKPFQIDKAFQIKIEQQQPPKAEPIIKKISENSPAKRGQDQRQGFNIKYPFDKALKHKRKQIQDYKQIKLLSIQSRFKRKQVTQRSYLQICRRINEQHDNRLEYFKEREGEIKSNWHKLLAISKENKLNPKYLEDDHEYLHNSISNIDASVSFDKWDFNSSAKKSLDGNLLDLGDGQNSKNYSLQSVLKYLEDQDTEKEGDDKKFRKNKSRQVIEAIAQRSKEISDRSVDQFEEVKQCYQKKTQKEKYQILEDAIQLEEEEHNHQDKEEEPVNQPQEQLCIQNQKIQKIDQQNEIQKVLSPRQQPKNNSIQLEETQKIFQTSSKKKIEAKSQSQSLLISQIEAASPSDYIYSDKDIVQSAQKTILRQLLFKDAQSQQKQKKECQALCKFIQLVNQKLVLSNIKLINSIKFMFAKMGEQRKHQKAKTVIRFPPIQSDINAINTWLLEISHFILDNYQSVVRQNLINIKQPPGLELLALTHKNIPYVSPYETVPQYVFKDFQFYYIKTLARNYGIGAQRYDAFSTLLYTFHRSLIDSLNLALMQQLLTGRRWLEMPWSSQFKQKKRITGEHAKVCLQRSINVVSNWGEYGLGRLQFDDDIAELQSKQYEEEKINLVCREQSLDIALSPIFTEANMLLQIANQIFDSQIMSAYNDVFG